LIAYFRIDDTYYSTIEELKEVREEEE